MIPYFKRKILASSVALLLISAAVASAAQPAVLQQVPDDAAIVVVVKNLKQLATKLSNAGTRMKLPVPEDLLATVMGKVGISDGLDQNGSMAYALLDVGKDQKDPGTPPMLMIIPTTDSKAMLKSLDSEAPDAAGIMKVTLPDEPDPGFAVVSGNFLVISPQSASLTRFLARTGTLDKKLSPDSAAAMDANDVVLYTNVPAFGAKATEAVESTRDLASMQMATSNLDKTSGALLDVMINSVFDLAKQSLTDCTAALVTFRLNDDGAVLGTQAQFKPDSPIGKFIATQKSAPAANLVGLPDGKLLFAAAGTWDKSSIRPLFENVANQILTNPDIKESAQFADIKKVIDIERDLVGGLSGEKMAFYAPTDPASGWLDGVVLADIDDPKKALDAATLMSKLNLGTDTQGIKIEQKVEPDAKTVKGVSLLKLTATYTPKDDAPPQTAAAIEMLKKIYGAQGMVIYYGVVGKQLLAVFGSDDALLESAITAAQSADTTLTMNPEIVAANKSTLPNPLMVAYLPITRWVSIGLKQAGMAPPDAPADKIQLPLTVSTSVTGSTITHETYLPMPTVIDLAATVEQYIGQLMPH